MADTHTHPPYARWAHVLLRVITGLLFMQHGLQKIVGMFGGMGGSGGMTAPMWSLPWFAGVLELVGGLLIVIGLLTRPTAFVLCGEMAVAYFMVHFPQGFWPIENKGEMAVLYCFVFLYFSTTGAGAVSLDYILSRNRPRPVMA